jgi:hypothetical protein
MKVEDLIYFEYLSSFAWDAVNNDAPSPFVSLGRKYDFSRTNPEFEKWCQSHGTTVADEVQKETFVHVRDLMLLVWAQDKRAKPIFRKGLKSNNALIIDQSVSGLGVLGDPADIDAIINAAEGSPDDIDPGVAMALAYYKDPRDRDLIVRRLQGSRLYERYLLAVKAEEEVDRRRAAAAREK